ncbi:hypothetical protein ACHAW5_010463 [Stephanodiscus triporus]|uniref:Elongator complex protein 5 n=1 Tax=Stephanodiscus triporus TaxID=2934178 RepID=A0ABD3P7Z6_9STRA
MVHPSVLSPIVVPVLHESIRPSEMRYLEDVSDAMVHLKLMDASLNGGDNGSSASANDASNSNNAATVVSFGMMDLVRRGGGGVVGGIRGGKLMHHCVPLRIMRSSASSIGRGDHMDVRGSYYWIFDNHSDFDATEDFGDKARPKQALTNQSSGRSTKSMNAEAGDQRKQGSSNVTASSGPRIYYEDNDPEFDDYDEEEGLDDDLDL